MFFKSIFMLRILSFSDSRGTLKVLMYSHALPSDSIKTLVSSFSKIQLSLSNKNSAEVVL